MPRRKASPAPGLKSFAAGNARAYGARPMLDAPALPDRHGHFGRYGGMFVPETLMTALLELAEEYERAKNDPLFQQ